MKVSKRQLRRIIKEEKANILKEWFSDEHDPETGERDQPQGYKILDVMTMEDMLEDLESRKEIYLTDEELGDFMKWSIYDEKILGKNQLRSDWNNREERYRVKL